MSAKISSQEAFPTMTRLIIKHWGKLLRNGYASEPAKLTELDAILTEAFELADHRNAIVHSFWPYGQDKNDEIKLSSIKPKPGDSATVIYSNYIATIEGLDDVNIRMSRLYHRAMAFSFNSHKLADRSPSKDEKVAE
jgi:hypothetical protein